MKEQRQFFFDKLNKLNDNPLYSVKDKRYLEKSYKESIDYYDKLIADPSYYNVIGRIQERSERLKSLLAHELMHRITQTFDEYDIYKYIGDIEKNNKFAPRWIKISQQITNTYNMAIQNGDAKKISKYATTNRAEFLSEANSMIESGFNVPDYIKTTINDMKRFIRSET